MAQETLKITITADNKQAVQNIQQTVTATNQLGNAFRTLPNVSNQATNALGNLSRIAQDAPYGFMAISNNLNPMLESFQRLKAESGSTGAALKAMAQGLIGPAGIGLALGAVSSLIVAFGPKIASFISGTKKATEEEDKFATSLRNARSEASETGIRLQAYLSVTQQANISDQRRAEALKAVKDELGKVNSAYANTITNVDQARKAIDLYTQAMVTQAITSRYIDEIANKTIALADANKKILQTGREYYRMYAEINKLLESGQAGEAVDLGRSAYELGKQNKNARKEAIGLKNGINELNKELSNTINLALSNPFYNFIKGANDTATSTNKASKEIEKLGKQARTLKVGATEIIQTEKNVKIGETPAKLEKELPMWAKQYTADQIFKTEAALKQYNFQMQLANNITETVTPAFEAMFQAMANGENIGKSLEESFKRILIQLSAMVVKTLILKSIMAAFGLPSFGGGGGFTNFSPFGASNNGGMFVLKGQDLLLATNRAQKASNLKGQNISLA